MAKTYNWGIIGLGRIAHKFAQDLRHVPNARLWAVASNSKERADVFAKEYNAPHAFGTYEEIVDCPDLDIVYIAMPHVGHCENTVLCLRHKIPVLCEKPLAMNMEEARRMFQASRENQTFFMEAMWTRFLPTTHQLLTWIEEGALGQILGVKADFGFRAPVDPEGRLYNPVLGGGALLDIGVYPAFLSLLVFDMPAEIKAAAHMGSTGVDEEIGAVLSYADGAMAHLHASIRSKTKTEAFIYGTDAVVHIHSRWHEATDISLLAEGQRPLTLHFERSGFGYHYEAVEAMRCLEAGWTESPQLPLAFSEKLMILLDEIRNAAGVPLGPET